MTRQEFIDRFLAASYLYFQLHGKTAANISNDELTELFEILNADSDLMLCTDHLC